MWDSHQSILREGEVEICTIAPFCWGNLKTWVVTRCHHDNIDNRDLSPS